MDTRIFIPRVKWSGRETDHLPPSSAEVEIVGAIPPFPMRIQYVVLNYLFTETYLTFGNAPASYRINVIIKWLHSLRDLMYGKYLYHQQKVDT
jgi:hypothetical protein